MSIHCHRCKRVYGIRKIHAELGRKNVPVARCTIERLCRELGIRGTVRGRFPVRHDRLRRPGGQLTWPNATSPRRRRTSFGLPI